MTLLILAAGLGSRYGGTKQFDGVGPQEEYLLEFTMYDAVAVGFRKIVLVTRTELMQEVSDYFATKLPESIEFQCISQKLEDVPRGFSSTTDRAKPWGTAHATWSSRNVIDGKFTIVNADDLYGRGALREAFDFGQEHGSKTEYGLIGYKLSDTLSSHGTVSRGVCRLEKELLKAVTEYTKLSVVDQQILDQKTGEKFTGNEAVSMNLWVLDSSVYIAIERIFLSFFGSPSNQEKGELYIPLVVQELINSKSISVKVVDGRSEWYGITYKEDKAQLVNHLINLTQKGTYPTPLWK